MMFKHLKERAKDALRENFGAKLRLFLIPIFGGIISMNMTYRSDYNSNIDTVNNFDTNVITTGLLLSLLLAMLIGFLIGALLSVIIDVITVGARFNYIKIYRGERTIPRFKNVFAPFKDGSWIKIFVLHLVTALLLGLLTITVIGIPFAIYLGLGWSQKDYILFDQLESGTYNGIWGVLNASSQVMRGSRGNYFLFLLSFILWYILSGITLGLAKFWTTPYIEMSTIAYYQDLIDPNRKTY
ncbi:DUF975 family protein [Lactococcus ileimucosae]|uniref:DUF975 family protein n=1 Tax=Lactococcus ileimucosae TaxID=2941329 RepID=A0ABV4D758_9LACT